MSEPFEVNCSEESIYPLPPLPPPSLPPPPPSSVKQSQNSQPNPQRALLHLPLSAFPFLFHFSLLDSVSPHRGARYLWEEAEAGVCVRVRVEGGGDRHTWANRMTLQDCLLLLCVRESVYLLEHVIKQCC